MTNNNTYTAFIVREENTRRFLTRPAYSGRIRGIWNTKPHANIFFSRNKAQSCASNINSRRPEGYSAYHASVEPIILTRRPR